MRQPASSAIAHAGRGKSVGAERMADALARAFALWRDRNYARRRDAIAAIADSAGYSVAMLENSIDALLKPFTDDALKSMAGADVPQLLDRQAEDGWIYRGGQCCGRGNP